MIRLEAAPAPARAMTEIEAVHLDKAFTVRGEELPVLSDVSLVVAREELVAVIGPSGCGKSTLLNILAGLELPDRGTILVDRRDVTGKVGVAGYMPQKDLLLPWKSVLDNTIIGLELSGVSRRAARQEARAWFPRFGLQGFERVYPATISGGMRQRAALLRTFLAGRDILLLDEPLGALDALTRMDMQQWLLDIWSSFRKTIVLVTHDVDEAIYLSDRIYVMTPRPGRIEAVIEVPIQRPRPLEETVTSAHFARLKRTLLDSLGRSRREP